MSNPRLSIRIASDWHTAYLSVAAGPAMDRVDLDAAIAESGVVSGIVEQTCQRIAAELDVPNFECPEEILAIGSDAKPGRDAWLELTFTDGILAGHAREDGSFDYHDRELLKPACVGDILGVVHPEVPGIAGRQVDGTAISVPPVRPLGVRFLPGVERGADMVVRAARDGVVLYKAGESIDVVDRLVHQGPVDLHSGNLRMQGSIVVKGDVFRPFLVEATGDIEILGNVDSGTVRAGGSLSVRGGVRGGDGGVVCAEGDLTVRHAEAAELHSGGQLRLQESVNSRLVAAQVHASGRMRGGSAVAESQIVIKEAGAANGADTRLTVGEPLVLPVSEAQRVITVVKTERKQERMSERAHGHGNDHGKGEKSGHTRAELDAMELQRLTDRARRRESLLDSAFIQVGLAHPGVIIRIGDAHLTLDEPAKSTRYSLDRETASIRVEKVS